VSLPYSFVVGVVVNLPIPIVVVVLVVVPFEPIVHPSFLSRELLLDFSDNVGYRAMQSIPDYESLPFVDTIAIREPRTWLPTMSFCDPRYTILRRRRPVLSLASERVPSVVFLGGVVVQE
jgi:hypothetical protein